MAWNNAVVTNNGVAMLRKVLDGETLIIDNAGGGSGTVLPATLMAQTALINKKQTFNVVSATDVTNGKKLNILITNIGLLDGYTMQQVGIWAHVGTDPSTLFAILQDETGIAISPEADLPDFALNFYAVIDFSNESSFELTVDTSALVNVGMMNTSKSEAISEAISQAATDATEKMTIAETNAKIYVDDLEIGGRNLILNSGIPVTNSNFIIQEYWDLSDELLDLSGGYYLFPEGEKFTISLKGVLGEGKTHFAVRTTGALYYPLSSNGDVHSLTFVGDGSNTFSVGIRAYPDIPVDSTIEWIKLERGDKVTDWTPAPQDIETAIIESEERAIVLNNESTGHGVISGLEVSAQATPDMTVAVSSGIAYTPNGLRHESEAIASVALDAAHATYPRIDIIYISAYGEIRYLAGSPVPDPTPPSMPSHLVGVVLAEIAVAASATTITTDNLTDKRLFKRNNNELDEAIKANEESINLLDANVVAHLADDATDAHKPKNVGVIIATKAQAEAGTANNIYMTPLRVKESIDVLSKGRQEEISTILISTDTIQVDIIIPDGYREVHIRGRIIGSGSTSSGGDALMRFNNITEGLYNSIAVYHWSAVEARVKNNGTSVTFGYRTFLSTPAEFVCNISGIKEGEKAVGGGYTNSSGATLLSFGIDDTSRVHTISFLGDGPVKAGSEFKVWGVK